MSIIKCGEFMEKDGIVVKRPGKRFYCPPMPEKMKINGDNIYGNAREDIDQMNALREIKWQETHISKYNSMKRLYYFQECIRFVRKTCVKVARALWGLNTQQNHVGAENICTQPSISSYAAAQADKQRS